MNDLRNTQYAPNRAIDAYIKRVLPLFSPESQKRVGKAILDAGKAALKHNDENTDAGARHIFRELVVASHMNEHGFEFEYEVPLDGKTPDWFDEAAGLLMESCTFERGGTSSFPDRVISSVDQKCGSYRNIVEAHDLRFVVAVYLDFLTGITLDECFEHVESFRQVFTSHEHLWAVVFFTETTVSAGIQQYGYFGICRNRPEAIFPNWPIQTETINQLREA